MPHRPILAALLLLTPAAHAQQQKPSHVEVIESFESDTCLRAWDLRDVTGTLSTNHTTEGQRSARLVYPQWKEGMGLWPASILERGRGGLQVRDWSRFEKLLFDVYSATDQQATLKLRLDDATAKRWTRPFAVPSKERLTVEIPISTRSINTTQIVHFDLYYTMSRWPLQKDPCALTAATRPTGTPRPTKPSMATAASFAAAPTARSPPSASRMHVLLPRDREGQGPSTRREALLEL